MRGIHNFVFVLLWIRMICFINGEEKEDEVNTVPYTPPSQTPSSQQDVQHGIDSSEHQEQSVLFIATDKWQEIKSYHKVPSGLHYRLNLETGMREAKILTDDKSKDIAIPFSSFDDDGNKHEDGIVEGEHSHSQSSAQNKNLKHEMVKENIIEALKNIKNEDPENEEGLENEEPSLKIKKKAKFRNYDTLKKEFESLHLNIESDSDILNRLITEYGQTNDEIRVNILEDLDYLIHQIDNAVHFVNMDGIRKIINPGLNSSNDEIRKGVMRVLGSASQSNPKVQIAAFEEGLLNQLLRIVARERDSSISSKAVFAVSCLVRGFPYGQKRLIEGGGLHTLREVFLRKDWHSLTLQLKVVSLIQDLLEERVNAKGEREKQLGKMDLMHSLVEGEWCSAVSSLLMGASFDKRGKREDLSAALGKGIPIRPDHDMVDKVINTMTLLVPSCDSSFSSTLPLLRSLKHTYSDLAFKERFQGDDGHLFFQGLANQIQFLLIKISGREEL